MESDQKRSEARAKSTIITLHMDQESAEIFQQAFADGKLAELGIVDVVMNPVPENSLVNERWTDKEAKNRSIDKNDPPSVDRS